MKVSYKFVLITSILIILTSFTLSFFFIRHQINNIKIEQKSRADALARNIAYSAEYAVLTKNYEQLNNIVTGIMREKDIIWVEIKDKDGNILFSKGEKIKPFYETSADVVTKKIAREKEELLFSETPVEEKAQEEKIGTVYLALTLKEMYKRVDRAKYEAILITLLVIFISIGIIYLAFKEIFRNLQLIISQIKETTEKTVQSTEQMAATTQQSTISLSQLSNAMTQIANTIAQVTQSVQVFSTNIQNTNTSVQKGNELLLQVIDKTKQVKSTTDNSVKIISELAQKTSQIGEIVNVISKIADQTNLLSLNAAIEAARAGEAGRGFAVVADEVRKLAENSSKSAGEIAKLIETIQSDMYKVTEISITAAKQVQENVVYSSEIEKTYEIIRKAIQNIATEVDQIAASTEEVSANTEEVSATSQQQTAANEEISATAQNIAESAKNLQRLVEKFKI